MSVDHVHRRLVPAPVGPHPALHARRATRRRRVARRSSASCSCAAAAAPTRSTACGSSTRRPARSASSPIPRPCSAGATTRTCRPRSGPGASGPAKAAGGITTFATDAAVTVAAFAIAGRLFVGGLLSGHGPRAARRRPGVRPATRSARPARRLRQRAAAVHRRARRQLARARRRRARRAARRSRGAAPTSSPPRRWTASAATGGARTAPRLAVTRVDTAPVQRWHLADPADPAAAPRGAAVPGRRHGQRRRHAARHRPRRLDRRRRVGPRRRSRTSPTCAWSDAGLMPTVQSRDQRRVAGARRRPGDRRDRPLRFADHDDAWVELVPGVPRLAARRRRS